MVAFVEDTTPAGHNIPPAPTLCRVRNDQTQRLETISTYVSFQMIPFITRDSTSLLSQCPPHVSDMMSLLSQTKKVQHTQHAMNRSCHKPHNCIIRVHNCKDNVFSRTFIFDTLPFKYVLLRLRARHRHGTCSSFVM